MSGALSSLVLLLASAAAPPEYVNEERVQVAGYEGDLMEPFLSRDGEVLFFNNNNNPPKKTDIHWAAMTPNGDFEYRGRLDGANSAALDGVPTVDRDGRIYFVSTRSYKKTKSTIHAGKFADGRVTDVGIVPGDLSRQKAFWFNMDVEVSADGNRLYATDNIQRFLFGGGVGRSNLFVAERQGDAFFRSSDTEAIFVSINTGKLEYAASISADELTIFFNRTDLKRLRKRDLGGIGIYVATRSTVDEPFGAPSRIDAITGFVEGATISPDGCELYYHRRTPSGLALHRVTRRDCLDGDE